MELLISTFGIRRLLAMAAVFVALLLACVFVGVFAAPSVLLVEVTDLERSEARWRAVTEVTPLNQGLFAYFVLETERMQMTASKVLKARVTLRGRPDGGEWRQLWERSEDLPLVCREGEEDCESIGLARVPFVEYSKYEVEVALDRTTLPAWAAAARIEIEMISGSFTLFELYARVALLLMTLAMGALFLWRMRRFRFAEWAAEQKWTLVLLVSLIGLNDPFFALSIRWGFFDVMDQLLAAWFLSVLLLFWLVMFDTVLHPRPEERTMRHFFLPKLALVGALWVSLTTLYLSVEFLQDTGHPVVVAFSIVTLLLTSGYTFWLVFLSVKLFPQLKVHLGVLFFFSFTCGVIVLTVMGILFGFLGSLRASATEFLAFFGLFNFYCFVLVVSYLPARGEQRGLEIIQVGGTSDEDFMANELSMSSSTDFEISLSDVGIKQPVASSTHPDDFE